VDRGKYGNNRFGAKLNNKISEAKVAEYFIESSALSSL
jgi:hypothetical protein